MKFDDLTAESLRDLSFDDLARLTGEFPERKEAIRKELQILYYQPASKTAAQIHYSNAKLIGVGGGNRSSKTTTCLVEIVALATGSFPIDFQAVFREKFRGPLNVRVCVESLTTFLHLADRSEVGRARVNQYLKPDPHTRRPRLVFHRRCHVAATQIKRFAWDEHRRSNDRDVKQSPKPKYDDYPAMMRYLLNYEPTFRLLYGGAPILRRPGTRRGAY